MIAIDLSKQQALYADLKAIKQIHFTGNLNRQNVEGQNTNDMFFVIKDLKETIFDFLKAADKV